MSDDELKQYLINNFSGKSLSNLKEQDSGAYGEAHSRGIVQEFINEGVILGRSRKQNYRTTTGKKSQYSYKKYKELKNLKKLTLEDHVNSIISAGGPQGALCKRYQYDFLELILIEIRSRGLLLDLRSYHFGAFKRGFWINKKGEKNYVLARQAVGELISILMSRYNWSFEQAIINITANHFRKEQINFGSNLGGVLSLYNRSNIKAVLDFLNNHPDENIRKRFSDLEVYHFKKASANTWTKKDGTKNYELARKAFNELINILKERYNWSDEEVIKNLRSHHLNKEPIKYGATLMGCFASVYESSINKLLEDLSEHNERLRLSKSQFLEFLSKDDIIRDLSGVAVMLNGNGFDVEKIIAEMYEGRFKDQGSVHDLLEQSRDEVLAMIRAGLTNLGVYIGDFTLGDKAIIPLLLGQVLSRILDDNVTVPLEQRLEKILRLTYSPRFNQDPQGTLTEIKSRLDSYQGRQRALYQKLYDHYEAVLMLGEELN